MFGLIISGRPVDATPQAITETQYAFKIVQGQGFGHIVVFLLPGTQMPLNTAASVYVQIPPAQDFKLLGAIGPGKESAIFKVSGLKPGNTSGSAVDGDGDLMTDDASPGVMSTSEIIIGVSIEPAAQVEAQLATLKSSSQSAPAPPSNAIVRVAPSTTDGRVATKLLAQRIIGNAYNSLASHGTDSVSLKAFEDWWKKFEKKVDRDPSFLDKDQD